MKEGYMKLSLQLLLGVALLAQLVGCVYVDGGRRHYGWHRHHHSDAAIQVQIN
jgi:hypothetical protein